MAKLGTLLSSRYRGVRQSRQRLGKSTGEEERETRELLPLGNVKVSLSAFQRRHSSTFGVFRVQHGRSSVTDYASSKVVARVRRKREREKKREFLIAFEPEALVFGMETLDNYTTDLYKSFALNACASTPIYNSLSRKRLKKTTEA